MYDVSPIWHTWHGARHPLQWCQHKCVYRGAYTCVYTNSRGIRCDSSDCETDAGARGSAVGHAWGRLAATRHLPVCPAHFLSSSLPLSLPPPVRLFRARACALSLSLSLLFCLSTSLLAISPSYARALCSLVLWPLVLSPHFARVANVLVNQVWIKCESSVNHKECAG